MADMFSVGGGGGSQLDQLVAAYKATQQPQFNRLNQRKTQLERSSTYYTNLNSRLNSLISQIDRMDSDDAANRFATRQVTSSASDFASASATSSAIEGVNTLKVNRLATSDILISSRLQIEEEFGVEGEQVIEFVINGETKSLTVEFDGTENNSDALTKIVNAINNTEDLGLTAGKVNDTTTTTRLTLRNQSLGGDFKIDFIDSDILAKLGITQEALNPNSDERTISSSNGAGYRVANPNELSSSATVNGIEVTRNTNSLDDVLTGVSIQLNRVQTNDDPEIILSTGVNSESVESFIQPFLDNFNNLVRFLNSDRDQLRGDATISGLRFSLRSILTQEVTTAEDGNPRYLNNIGINISSDGTLTIGNKERLAELLRENPKQVSDIFLSEDGFVSKVKSNVNRLKGEDDVIRNRTLDIANQIDAQKKRISDLEARIDRQAEAQRNQYRRLLEAFYGAQAQYNSFNSFMQTGGFGQQF